VAAGGAVTAVGYSGRVTTLGATAAEKSRPPTDFASDLAAMAAAIAAADGDHARLENGVGYAKPDVALGHGLAVSDPGTWDDATCRGAAAMLRRYRRQLALAGFDTTILSHPALSGGGAADREAARAATAPALFASRTSVRVDPAGGYLATFPYDEEIVGEMRRTLVRGSRYVGNRTWWIAKNDAAAFLALVLKFGFSVDEETAEVLRADAAVPLPPNVWLESDDVVVVHTDSYSELFVVALREGVPRWKRQWRPKPHEEWHIQVDGSTALVLPDIFSRCGLRVDPAVAGRLAAVAAGGSCGSGGGGIVEADAASIMGRLDTCGFVIGELFPWQVESIAYMEPRLRPGVLCADSPGRGKTISALAVAALGGFRRVLVVSPLIAKRNWVYETNRHLPSWKAGWVDGISPAALDTVFAEFGDTDRVLLSVNYDIVHAHAGRLQGWADLVVFDESHKLRKRGKHKTEKQRLADIASGKPDRAHKGTRRTVFAKDLADDCRRRGGGVILLSGTPVVTVPADLIPQLELIGRLDELGGWPYFTKRYCGRRVETFRGKKVTLIDGTGTKESNSELRQRLLETCMVRHLPEPGSRMPPSVVRIGLDDTRRVEYQRAQDDAVAWIVERAEQIAVEMGLAPDAVEDARVKARIRAEDGAHLVRMTVVRRLLGLAKVPMVIQWVAEFLDGAHDGMAAIDGRPPEERKLVLFAHHNDVADEIASYFDAPKITQSTSPTERDAAVRRFQTDPDTKLIVCTQAGGVAITLTAANHVAFAELEWLSTDLDQAIGRSDRIGQTHPVVIWYLMADNTEDDHVYASAALRERTSRQILDGETAPVPLVLPDLHTTTTISEYHLNLGIRSRSVATPARPPQNVT
jgi:hypothetical protein